MFSLLKVENGGLEVVQILLKHRLFLMVMVEEELEHMEEGLNLLLSKRLIGHCY